MKIQKIALLLTLCACSTRQYTPSHQKVHAKILGGQATYNTCYENELKREAKENKYSEKKENYLFDILKSYAVSDEKTFISHKVFALNLEFKKHTSGRVSDFKVNTEEKIGREFFTCLEKTTRQLQLPSPKKEDLKRMDYIEVSYPMEFFPPKAESVVKTLKSNFMADAEKCFEKVPAHKPKYGTVDIVMEFDQGQLKKREYLLRPGTPSFLDLMFPCLNELLSRFPKVDYSGKFILPFNTYSGFKAFLDARET